MNKNSFLYSKVLLKTNIAIFCILGMMIGFLCSPAVSSISVFLFGVNAIWDVHPRRWFSQKWWLLGVLWIACYAITWFWSIDKTYWETGLQVKLPFLILPLAFSFLPKFTVNQIQFITLSLALILAAGAYYSINFLINDYEYYMIQYRYSHLLPTPVRGDHIRFSLAIALYIMWGFYAWQFLNNKIVKWLTGLLMLLLFIYLNILAAKSGLLAIYLFLFCWGIYLAFTWKKLAGLAIVVGLVLVIGLSVTYIPTLTKRFAYIQMTWSVLKNGDKSGNYGDIGRLISYNIAINLIKQHPLAGVGTGDIFVEMKKGYDQWYPLVVEESRLVPHNQFIFVALGCGIPAMLLFAIWAFYPLMYIRKNRASFYFFMVWLVLFIQLMIEPVLEVQYGVFVFLFFLLMQWHTMKAEGKGDLAE